MPRGGSLILAFQPAEEVGQSARAMVDDGLFERFGQPDVVLGQHVAPMPAGFIGLRAGPSFAASDALKVIMHGRGAHGSRPEVSVDPVVMAAATVLRLQTVSREVAGTETAVLTIGALRAGIKENIIPDNAELLMSIRTFDTSVRAKVMAAIGRILHARLPPRVRPDHQRLTTPCHSPPWTTTRKVWPVRVRDSKLNSAPTALSTLDR
jgi:amidohydrolase